MLDRFKASSSRQALIAWFHRLAVVILLAGFAAQSLDLGRRASITYDEPGHLVAGLSWWLRDDYRIHTLNLFLTQKWAALPAYLSGVTLPPVYSPDLLPPNPIGEEMLFRLQSDPCAIVAKARAMVTVLGVSLGLLIYFVARRVFGPPAALGALLFYAVCPPFISQSAQVMVDLAAALWFFAAIVGYWWVLEKPNPARVAWAGIALGLLALTKFSFVMFPPVALGLLGLHLTLHRTTLGPGPLLRLALAHLGGALVAWATIWLFFGFTAHPGGAIPIWHLDPTATKLGRTVAFLRDYRLLPFPWLDDLQGLHFATAPRFSYLRGELRPGGSWDYFPTAFLIKSPFPLLVAIAVAARAGLKSAPGRVAALWLAALLFLLPLLAGQLNIGHRHVLPLYPPLFILAGGGLAWLWQRAPSGRGVAVALALASIGEAAWLHGRQHTYFNALAGGPSGGHRWLADSSLDWGAELPRLAIWEQAWRKGNPATPLYLLQSGPNEPALYGSGAIALDRVPSPNDWRPGLYVFGMAQLFLGYAWTGPYTAAQETAFQARRRSAIAGAPDPNPSEERSLALARLTAFCRHRAPSRQIADSYFAYELDAAALLAVRDGPLPFTLPESSRVIAATERAPSIPP